MKDNSIKLNDLLLIIDKLNKEKEDTKISFEKYGLKILNATSQTRSSSWQKDLVQRFKNHLVPFFKDYSLNEIKTSDIDLWQATMLKKYSSSHTKKCKNTLSLILRKAVADDLISKNYCDYTQEIRGSFKKRDIYSLEELSLMLKYSTGWFKLFLALIMSTGLRPGEAIGLMWDDIDFKNGVISLKRSISKGCIVDESSKTNITKNHKRLIPIDKSLKLMLAKYYSKADTVWVFTNQFGDMFYDASNINKRHFKPLVQKLNIPYKSMYALRHSFVTHMKNKGKSDSWLKSVIGHTQHSNVLNSAYFHFDDNIHIKNNENNFFEVLKEYKAND